MEQREQHIPLKAYRSQNMITVAAPMPGLQPSDVEVEITSDNKLILRGHLRGLQKDVNEILVNEWEVGNYYREYTLPAPVDGETANINFENGVLVVALPISSSTHAAQLTLNGVGRAHGTRVGH